MLARLSKRVSPCGHGDYVSQVALPSADHATQRLLKRPAPRVSQERADQPLFPGVGWHRLNTPRLYGFKLVGCNPMREMVKAIEKAPCPLCALALSENTRLASGGRSGDRGCPNLCVAQATNPVALPDCAETKIRRLSVTDRKEAGSHAKRQSGYTLSEHVV